MRGGVTLRQLRSKRARMSSKSDLSLVSSWSGGSCLRHGTPARWLWAGRISVALFQLLSNALQNAVDGPLSGLGFGGDLEEIVPVEPEF